MSKTVTVVVSRQTTPLNEKSFSIPCIFTTDSPVDTDFSASTSRKYNGDEDGLAAVKADWGVNSETYKAATALLSQTVKVSEFRIFRRASAVARVKTITFDNPILTGQSIACTVNGTALSATPFDTNSSTTLGNLADKIELVEGVASASVSGSVITVTASVEWDLSLTSIAVTGTGIKATATVATTTAGNTQADDLAVAAVENKDWYAMLSTSASKGAILCTAKSIEAMTKMAYFMTSDADAINNVANNVMAQIKAFGYTRTAIFYTHDTTQHIAAAIAGRCLPLKPGKVVFALKTLAGVTVSPTITTTQIDNILSNNGNVYLEELNKNITKDGTVGSGDYIDIIRDLDYVVAQLVLRIFKLITDKDKMGFTDPSISEVDTEMKMTFSDAYTSGIILNNYITKPPKASSISSNVRANRILPDIPFEVTVQGAIQAVSFAGIVKV